MSSIPVRTGALGAILLAGLLMRALPAASQGTADPRVFDTADSAEYLRLASSLVAGAYEQSSVPELHRPPGYPALLAIGVAAGAPRATAVVLQVALSTLTIAIVFLITARIAASHRAATAAAVLCAFAPVQVGWASRIMAEAPLAFALTLCAWWTLRAIEDGAWHHVVGAGLSMAAAAYFKPIATYVGLGLLVSVGLLYKAPAARRRAFFVAALSWLALLPWTVRNGIRADYWGFSSKADRVLSFSAPAVVRSELEGRPFADVRAEVGAEPATGPAIAVARREGLGVILSAPSVWAAAYARGIARTALSPGAMPILESWGHDVRATSASVFSTGSLATLSASAQRPSPFLWMTILLAPFTALTLGLPAAAFLSGRMREPAARLLAAGVLYFLLLSGGLWGQSRFRAPFEPLLCALAGVASQSFRISPVIGTNRTSSRSRSS